MADAENGQEKTEDATPRKIEKAREEGQAARSRELVTFALITAGAVLLLLWLPVTVDNFVTAARDQFTHAGAWEWRGDDAALEATDNLLMSAVLMVFMPLAGLFIVAIGSSIAVGGLVFSPKAARPKFERLSPIKGLGRMFSQKAIVELLKSIGKIALIAGVAVAFLASVMSRLMALPEQAPAQGFGSGLLLVLLALLFFGLVLALIAAIDVPFQIAEHAKQLKMTLQEVRDEMKDSEGRPEVKARIRRAQQALANQRMMTEVPTADVIITNPEHFAVALRYETLLGAPKVVAAGADLMAFRVRELGREHDIPELRLPPLARALFFTTPVGSLIPEGLYASVAQVLAYLQNLEAYRRGRLPARPSLGTIAVPKELRRTATGQPEAGSGVKDA